MQLRILLLMLVMVLFPLYGNSAALPMVSQVTTRIDEAEKSGSIELVDVYKNVLKWLNEKDEIVEKSNTYQNSIDNFATLSTNLHTEIKSIELPDNNKIQKLSMRELELELTSNTQQQLSLYSLIQQKQEESRELVDSLGTLPQQQTQSRKLLSDAETRLAQFNNDGSPLSEAKAIQIQAEIEARREELSLLALEQLSAANRQELLKLQLELYRKQYEKTENYAQQIRTQLNSKRQDEAQQTLETTLQLLENSEHFPESIKIIADENMVLSQEVSKQTTHLNAVFEQQSVVNTQIDLVKKMLYTLEEQAQWLNMSTALSETLRAQLAKIPKKTKSTQLAQEIASLRLQRFNYSNILEQLNQDETFVSLSAKQMLTAEQKTLLDKQIKGKKELLNSLMSGSDTLIFELTKLQILSNQLSEVLDKISEATHRYFFWVADISPININYPVDVIKDINRVLSLNTFSQFFNALVNIFSTPFLFLIIVSAIILIIFKAKTKKSYQEFLERSSSKIGKVTQDNFYLTLRVVAFSLLNAFPIPFLWWIIGYTLMNAWDYPIAAALGHGINAASPILWVFMISAAFSHTKGLYIAHFNWSQERVRSAMKYYRLSVWVLVPLVMLLVAFNTYNDREFSATLGRLCFILICIVLIFLTRSIYRANVPLYLDKKGSGDNIFNNLLWLLLRTAPWAAGIAACLGYLATSATLLVRLEASVVIWFGLLLVYYIIRRWMFIQRRRIEFERAKQRRAERLALRLKNSDEQQSTADTNNDAIEEPVIIDLDTISAKSLQLIRSILSLISLVSVILLWSELHSAFSFLENITLWTSTTVVQGVEETHKITLASLLIVILVVVITIQLVKNLPSLLELTILQHIELSPGMGYAIITILKYVILMIGITIASTLIGISWSTVQWLIAALGVGLGFGLQEIFANFISGLILLFERPVRIGDTVTIRDLTGTITKINTRATTIVDWDRREIIMPNKAFITEQLVNWSLSDSVTRIVLTIPATIDADSQLVIEILKEVAAECEYVIDDPAPEVFLVDIQEGIQLFELRIFANELGHRMPVRSEIHQLIIKVYQEHNLVLPFPPFQVSTKSLNHKNNRRAYQFGGI